LTPILTFNNVSVFRDGKPILKNVNFIVNKGEIHAILGPNGAGKSTLANLVMGTNGFSSPDEGEIIFKDKLLNNLSISERAKLGITMAWQDPARFEGITVEDYLNLCSKGKKSPAEALKLVGLDENYLLRFLDDTLSGGERKRIELACVLVCSPELAVLDEPDSGIDFPSMEDIARLIKILKENGSTVLMITHREEIAEIADRATLLCDGKVVQTGSPEEVGKKFKNMCVVCKVKNPELVGGK